MFAPERYLEAHLAAFPEFLRTGRGNSIGKTVEMTARRKDGGEIEVDLSLSAISLNGEWHALGIMRDITGRKQAEQALRDSEEKFRQLAENIREVFFVLTADQALYVSPAFEQVWGISREAVCHRPFVWQESIHPDDVDRVRLIGAQGPQVNPVQFEYRIRTPNGEEKWMPDQMRAVHFGGLTVALQAFEHGGARNFQLAAFSNDHFEKRLVLIAIRFRNVDAEEPVRLNFHA